MVESRAMPGFQFGVNQRSQSALIGFYKYEVYPRSKIWYGDAKGHRRFPFAFPS